MLPALKYEGKGSLLKAGYVEIEGSKFKASRGKKSVRLYLKNQTKLHACNSSYSGGRDQEDCGLKSALGK
jgi:hypothetical protein